MTPTPFPVPLPVEFGPHEADWWMVCLTAVGIIATLVIAFFTLRANIAAGEASKDAARANERGIEANERAIQAQVKATEAFTEALNISGTAAAAQADALRRLVDSSNGYTSAEEVSTDVTWSLSRDVGRNRWILRNVGTATAYSALIHGFTEQDSSDLLVFFDEPMDIAPHSVIQFGIERSLASPPATVVVVEWTDDLGTERQYNIAVV